MARLFERLQGIEDEKSLDWVKVDAAKKTIAKPVKRAAARRKQPKRIKAK
jgi:hypothetical protein